MGTLKERYSARELAEKGLENLPSTKRGVNKKARNEGWDFQHSTPKGGGPEVRKYSIDSLPSAARQELIAQELSGEAHYEAGRLAGKALRMEKEMEQDRNQRRREKGLAKFRRLPDEAQEKAEARFAVVKAWRRYKEETTLSAGKARARFAEMYDDGVLDLGGEVREIIDGFSANTLYRWNRWLREEGLARLAGAHFKDLSDRVGGGIIERDEEMREIVHGMIHEYGPHINSRVVHEQLRAKVGDRVPSQRTISRYLKRWRDENKSLASYLDDPETWRGSFQTAFGNMDDEIVRPNQIWELDSTIADITLETEDGDYKRYALVGAIDVYTRRVRYVVTDQSRARAIAIVLRRAIKDWGIPETLRMDNGKDYTSKHIDMLTTMMGIDVEFCDPFSPDQKPFIERMYRTMQHGEMSTMPGFTGHDVAERQKLRARREERHGRVPLHLGAVELTQVEFQSWLDEWCESIYERREHSTLGCSPWEKARRWTGTVRRVQDERVLDVLLEPVPDVGSGPGKRTVQKDGISVGGVTYMAPELEEVMRQEVLCLYDPHAAGRLAVFSQPDMEFVCYATAPETSEERKRIAKEAKARQRKRIRDQVGEFREAAKGSGSDQAWKDILAARAKKAEEMQMMSKPAEEHETEFTRAARDAADAREALDEDEPLPKETPDGIREKQDQLLDEMRARQEEEAQQEEEEQRRMQERKREMMEAGGAEEDRPMFDSEMDRFQWIRKRDRQGKPISEEDREFFEEFAGRLGVEEDLQLSS